MGTRDDETYDSESGNAYSADEDDKLLFSMEAKFTASKKLQTEKFPYEVISPEQIVQNMVDCIREVNTVVQLPPTTTRVLLHHFKWDEEKLYERYYGDDQDALFEEVHVINPYKKPPNSSTKDSSFAPKIIECGICFVHFPKLLTTGIACGHRFCTQCWKDYLTIKIMEHGICQSIACAAHGCDILVDDLTIMSLIEDPKVKLKYQHLITNSFVECNRLLRWCPQPGCNYAIAVQYVSAQPVTCRCRHTFCFACAENWHDPVNCNLLKKWLKKCADDSETSNWIAANTKECPKCNTPIEKNGGCNYMTCTNQNCKTYFCWICLTSWYISPYLHACKGYNESETNMTKDAKEESSSLLQRYLFYYDRYQNHMQSLKFENKLHASVKDKMEDLQHQKMSWIDVQFLKKAADILCQCRQILMHTYVFAYYLENNNQSLIFGDNQKDLESATEILSKYLERNITQDNFPDIQQEVQDKYKYCESRCKSLLEHVHEGNKKNWWVNIV